MFIRFEFAQVLLGPSPCLSLQKYLTTLLPNAQHGLHEPARQRSSGHQPVCSVCRRGRAVVSSGQASRWRCALNGPSVFPRHAAQTQLFCSRMRYLSELYYETAPSFASVGVTRRARRMCHLGAGIRAAKCRLGSSSSPLPRREHVLYLETVPTWGRRILALMGRGSDVQDISP